jgi:hypothetical protein
LGAVPVKPDLELLDLEWIAHGLASLAFGQTTHHRQLGLTAVAVGRVVEPQTATPVRQDENSRWK